MNHYETVFILNPVLSDVQVKETVSKFEEFLTSRGAEMISKEERVMRFLTVSLDKHAISWAERRRAKLKAAKAN